ncbi:MAG: hypothetical protein ACRBBN_13520 [Methyloligellaceae bacterium]
MCDHHHDNDNTPLAIDYEKYLACLEDMDASEEEKREFIEALWHILTHFVDIGFGVHPVQQVFPDIFPETGNPDSDDLDSESSQQSQTQEG